MLQCYPCLKEDEFAQACHAFENRCCDRLENTNWSSVQWTGSELKIKQFYEFANPLPGLNNGVTESIVHGQEIETDDDNACGIERARHLHKPVVDFSITLSPTYAVPVLWFTCQQVQSLDEVYKTLVSEQFEKSLQELGVMGGISSAYHPVSDVPSFFVHPCNTHEALLAINNSQSLVAEDYLLLWIGVIGPSVGLYVPTQVVTEME